ncbi:MAG: aminodeoxychorismate lyase [Gammaproteobacteria bacterium]|nr:MAG: aminodeoxychorismate lyase [Gammaproteobacteria bacterium]
MHQFVEHFAPSDSLPQYGDGVFETMLATGAEIYHWRYHWARLQSSCQRLGIAVPVHDELLAELQKRLQQAGHALAVVKMLVSRGAGLRGYRTHADTPSYIHISVAPYAFNDKLYQGLSLRVCQTRLAKQPLLAGMKHCNRLEYLLARREPADAAFDEGLLLDYDDQLIEGLISNVFVVNGRRVSTPDLAQAGVAGTFRAYLLQHLPTCGYQVAVEDLTLDDVIAAEGVFLTNATHGVMPVKAIDGRPDYQPINKTLNAAEAIRQLTEHPSL